MNEDIGNLIEVVYLGNHNQVYVISYNQRGLNEMIDYLG